MSNVVQGLLSQLASLVSGLSPLAKAIVAAVLPLVSALVNMAIAGSFNTASIVALVTAAATSLAVYLVPNKAKIAPVPAPIPVPPAPAPAAKTPRKRPAK